MALQILRLILTWTIRLLLLGLLCWHLAIFYVSLSDLSFNIFWKTATYIYWLFLMTFLFYTLVGIGALVFQDDRYDPSNTEYQFLEYAIGTTEDLNLLFNYIVGLTWAYCWGHQSGINKDPPEDNLMVVFIIVTLVVVLVWTLRWNLLILEVLAIGFHLHLCYSTCNIAGICVGILMMSNYVFQPKFTAGSVLEIRFGLLRTVSYVLIGFIFPIYFYTMSRRDFC